MKKISLFLVIVALLVVPFTSVRATTDTETFIASARLIIAQLLEQIVILQKQLSELQARQAQPQTQKQTYTTPAPSIPLIVEPPKIEKPKEIRKELKIVSYGCGGSPTRCEVDVYYFEDGERKSYEGIINMYSDDGSRIIGEGKMVRDGRDGLPVAYFTYFPALPGIRTLTAVSGELRAVGSSRGVF